MHTSECVSLPSSFSWTIESLLSLNPSCFSTQSSQYKAKTRPQHMHAGSLSAAGTVYLEVGWQAGRATGSPGQGTVGRRGHLRQGHSYTPGFSGEKVKITSPQSTLLSGSHNSPVKSDDKRARECLGSSFYPWLLQQYPSNPCQLKLKTCSLCASHS